MIVPPCLDFDQQPGFRHRIENVESWQVGSRNSEILSTSYSDEQFFPEKGLQPKIFSIQKLFAKLFELKSETSEKAFSACLAFFSEYHSSRESIIKPLDIVGDSEGGLTIGWKNNEKYFEILFPETEKPYLYYSSGSSYGVQEPLTIPALVSKLQWLVGSGD